VKHKTIERVLFGFITASIVVVMKKRLGRLASV